MNGLTRIILCPILAAAIILPAVGQETLPKQSLGVENTAMGAYRALAELAFQAFQKGDNATAAKLVLILDRLWDKAELAGGKSALRNINPQLFKQTDDAMDEFNHPLFEYERTAPDSRKVKAAYHAYLEKLKQVDTEVYPSWPK